MIKGRMSIVHRCSSRQSRSDVVNEKGGRTDLKDGMTDGFRRMDGRDRAMWFCFRLGKCYL